MCICMYIISYKNSKFSACRLHTDSSVPNLELHTKQPAWMLHNRSRISHR